MRAAPEFWLGMVLLALFAFEPGGFPPAAPTARALSYTTLARLTSADFLHHLILPAPTLALYLQGLPLLLMRSNMLDVMHEDFITMARMKGFSGVAHRASATRRATRCCPSSPPSRSGSALRWAAMS